MRVKKKGRVGGEVWPPPYGFPGYATGLVPIPFLPRSVLSLVVDRAGRTSLHVLDLDRQKFGSKPIVINVGNSIISSR